MSSHPQFGSVVMATAAAVAILVFVIIVVRALFYPLSDEVEGAVPEHHMVQTSISLTERGDDAFMNKDKETTNTMSTREDETAEMTPPRLLVIPSIGVSAQVQHVGLSARGTMAVPNSFHDVGWYRYGTIPGERGSAVIDGHVDNGFGFPAVFGRLHEIKKGDEMMIVDEWGETISFVVESIALYDLEGVPLEEIFHRSDESRLNLITCGGGWDGDIRTYDKRLVVYGVRVDGKDQGNGLISRRTDDEQRRVKIPPEP